MSTNFLSFIIGKHMIYKDYNFELRMKDQPTYCSVINSAL